MAFGEPPTWRRRLSERLRDAAETVYVPEADVIGPTIDDFYLENEARRSSAERQVGRVWVDAEGRRYRVFWIEDTGELYALYEGQVTMRPDLWGGPSSPHRPKGWQPSVRVLAVIADHDEVVFRLEYRRPPRGNQPSLEWIDEVSGAAPRVLPGMARRTKKAGAEPDACFSRYPRSDHPPRGPLTAPAT